MIVSVNFQMTEVYKNIEDDVLFVLEMTVIKLSFASFPYNILNEIIILVESNHDVYVLFVFSQVVNIF